MAGSLPEASIVVGTWICCSYRQHGKMTSPNFNSVWPRSGLGCRYYNRWATSRKNQDGALGWSLPSHSWEFPAVLHWRAPVSLSFTCRHSDTRNSYPTILWSQTFPSQGWQSKVSAHPFWAGKMAIPKVTRVYPFIVLSRGSASR